MLPVHCHSVQEVPRTSDTEQQHWLLCRSSARGGTSPIWSWSLPRCTQWNWDIQTTIKDYVWNTISQNLFLLKQYPEYIFNFEGGVKYAWMKEYYPAQYEEMKKFIESGRWHISGASWDATDTLVPSIESAIRNIMLGQNYYRKEFGVESTDIFLPDCFGFGWTLPAIASHCGLIGFSSQKLQWRNKPFYGNDKYPFTVGLWQGIDGSTIMMTHGYAMAAFLLIPAPIL